MEFPDANVDFKAYTAFFESPENVAAYMGFLETLGPDAQTAQLRRAYVLDELLSRAYGPRVVKIMDALDDAQVTAALSAPGALSGFIWNAEAEWLKARLDRLSTTQLTKILSVRDAAICFIINYHNEWLKSCLDRLTLPQLVEVFTGEEIVKYFMFFRDIKWLQQKKRALIAAGLCEGKHAKAG